MYISLKYFCFAYWYDKRFKDKTGGPIKVYELCTNLKRLGHDVFLLIPKIGHPKKQTDARVIPIPVIDFPFFRFLSFQLLAILYAIVIILFYGKPNIIYVRIMWSFLPMILGKILNIPIILEVNDSPKQAYQNIKSKGKRKVVYLFDNISINLSDYIFPVTLKIGEELYKHNGVSFELMTVMPTGSNTELFFPMNKLASCKMLNFDPEKQYVGFIGTLLSHQGVDVLIKSALHIVKRYPDVMFLVVGDGPMRAPWSTMVNSLGLHDRFIFTGHVKYEKVPFYCSLMDICVSPLLGIAGERSPAKVFDYLACGKPVVMSEVADTGKIFEKSGSVCFVPNENPVALAEAINQLLSDEKILAKMGKKGRKFIVTNYDRKINARLVEKISYYLLNAQINPDSGAQIPR